MKTRRWQDWLILVAGVWLIFSPFYMESYAVAGSAALNCVIVGVLLAVASGIALVRPRPWEEWMNIVLGVWLVVAPFVLGFENVAAVTLNHVAVGAIVVGDAMIVLARSRGEVGAA